ncbi:MAG: cell division protein ZapA [Candidatus Symbiothrix sp.]|jgi:cell division protein ZapA|nr:cell division protein ZapA [Candidatus Symbiothrix sp.]
MNEDFFKIQLKLVDKYFPYTCKRSDEGIVRKAAKNLTDKYSAYSSRYSNANFQSEDILKLVGFHFSLEMQNRNNTEDLSPFVNKIEQLSRELEECIQLC